MISLAPIVMLMCMASMITSVFVVPRSEFMGLILMGLGLAGMPLGLWLVNLI